MPKPEPQPGMRAHRETPCARCPEPIRIDDRYVYRRGHPIHVACANGADDE